MDQSICKLTLVYPASIADDLIELIMTSKPTIGGFTTFKAEGHGFDFARASVSERVRGRVERGVLMAVMPRGQASLLLETVRNALPVPHMVHWLEPVLEVGRLADGRAAQGEPDGAAP
jgi:hypothetical protein